MDVLKLSAGRKNYKTYNEPEVPLTINTSLATVTDVPKIETNLPELDFSPQSPQNDEIIDKIRIFDIAKAIGVDIDNEVHLLGTVDRLIGNLEQRGKLHHWEFRFTLEGRKYWYN